MTFFQAHFLAPDLSSELAGPTLDIMSKGSVDAGLPMRFVEVDGRPVWGALGDLNHRRRSPSEVMMVSVPVRRRILCAIVFQHFILIV